MGLFDIFKSGPTANNILAQVRKAKEVYAQPEYRRMAMEKLLKWGTNESLTGLLERFGVVVQSPHWDEDEKVWLVDELVKIGDQSKPILREFILKKNDVNYVLKAFRSIANDDEAYRQLLIEALKLRPPSDHRSVQSKQELIAALSEFDEKFYVDLLLPYVHDHSDDVQCATIDALSKSNDDNVKNVLISLLASEEHSARVLRKTATLVADKQFSLGDNLKLSDVVAEDFMIKNGLLTKLR